MTEPIPKDIKTIPIYDKSGRVIGNVTGRREQVEQYSNRDLHDQLERDRQRERDRGRG